MTVYTRVYTLMFDIIQKKLITHMYNCFYFSVQKGGCVVEQLSTQARTGYEVAERKPFRAYSLVLSVE